MKPARSDALLAFGVVLLAAIEVGLNASVQPKWAAALTEFPLAIALAWRRTLPLVTAAVVSLGRGLEVSLGVPVDQPVVPLLVIVITLYSVAVNEPLVRAVAGFAVMVPGGVVSTLHIHGNAQVRIGNFAFGLIISGGAWAAGLVVRSRTQRTGELEQRAEQLEAERLVAVAEERTRIARELHDVIAHSVSVMVIQAEAAQAVLRLDAERALESLEAVHETGRQALVEMSRLVGLLREEGEEIGLAPQPGIADLDALVAQVREAGLPVDLHIEGKPRQVPLGVELSAYRVVQEALTNALKHAGPASAEVAVRYDNDALELEVLDDGAGSDGGHAGGHGLIGMNERVSLFGGELSAGPRPGGGFAVRARLPLHSARV
ncbi:MAG: sensor histidine kinase [Actinomycetota bacterium]|nr:sensor histidine kinase [Actinomycetota bacterium]